MSEAPVLFKLQTIDLEIEDTERRLAEVEGQLGETEELVTARNQLSEVKEMLRAKEAAMRAADTEVEDISAKIKPLETKLYGGTVKNPKELQSLEEDVSMHKKHRTRIEDQVLDLMGEIEELQGRIATMSAETKAVEEAWQAKQAELKKEKGELEARLAELKRDREALAATISQESLVIYENLRRTRKGKAVAKIEQNTCQGCRVSLPTAEVNRARSNPNLSYCSHCGRIIWVVR